MVYKIYNTTNISNAANFLETTIAVNQLSNNLFATMIMFVLFVLIFIIFSQYDKKLVLLADSAILSFIGILFFSLNMIGWTVLIVPLVTFFISLLIFKIYG